MVGFIDIKLNLVLARSTKIIKWIFYNCHKNKFSTRNNLKNLYL